ncbi:hypothetical protein HMPREF0682_2109 [Propionibacterium acidifaciens F0233]|uniref:Uncharacterized protein n=1 Tax=Propionibacterium acidifaciens F0233 TaxID=553198 RepID=U2PUQ4_9ACTN|nr:hypothetical protein HMPREF0682_2109 [Propionibacterium acidifaciens F0233]
MAPRSGPAHPRSGSAADELLIRPRRARPTAQRARQRTPPVGFRTPASQPDAAPAGERADEQPDGQARPAQPPGAHGREGEQDDRGKGADDRHDHRQQRPDEALDAVAGAAEAQARRGRRQGLLPHRVHPGAGAQRDEPRADGHAEQSRHVEAGRQAERHDEVHGQERAGEEGDDHDARRPLAGGGHLRQGQDPQRRAVVAQAPGRDGRGHDGAQERRDEEQLRPAPGQSRDEHDERHRDESEQLHDPPRVAAPVAQLPAHERAHRPSGQQRVESRAPDPDGLDGTRARTHQGALDEALPVPGRHGDEGERGHDVDRQGRPCALLRVPGQRPSTSRTASTAPPAQPPSPRPAAPDSTDAAPTRPGGPGGARRPRGCPAAGGRPASRAPVVIPARRRARSRWCAPPGCRERPPAPAGGRPRAGGRGSERQATTTRTPKTPRTPTAIAPGPSRPAASRPGTSSRPRQGVRAKRVGSSGSAPAPSRARSGQTRVTAAMASVGSGPRAGRPRRPRGRRAGPERGGGRRPRRRCAPSRP